MKKTAKKTVRKPIQDRAQATVGAILTAATHIFDREGIDGTSTNRIAEKAGVGIGSLYQYFRNKDQIVNALTEKVIEQKLEIIREVLNQTQTTSLEERVSAVVQALIQSKAKNSRLERMLEMQVSKMGIRLKLMEKGDRDMIAILTEYLEPFKDELKLKDLEFTLFIIVQAVKGAIILTNQARPEYLESKQIEPLLTKMVLAALRP